MTIRHTHRGSALLVVLGMVAFMVVSAVAFSAYMRYSRIPSSFLRQTDASRLLVKAALANAIDEVDAAIGNNPHPGVGANAYVYPRSGGGVSMNRNCWIGRVYMGTNVTSVSSTEGNTVSTLTLEGLAYLPPPLVNEVRYYSRRTRSAQWKSMNFDAGRFAFCAVDVSDYFDINALDAGVARSSEPDSRVSLAYLFENSTHTSSAGGPLGTADRWDAFMDSFRGRTKIPLVSLADWNLAMNDNGPFKTPFCNYVENATANFYGLNSETGDDADKIRLMTFVTDSYFPPTASASSATGDNQIYDLTDDNNQPWEEGVLKTQNNAAACEQVVNGDSKCCQRLANHLPFAACAALYDYLDEDRVPCSLALPTVERAPMVCGIEVQMNSAKLKVSQTVALDPKDPPKTQQKCEPRKKTVQYNIDGSELKLEDIQVAALLTYPFRHADGIDASGYKVDGVVLLYLTSSDMGLRPGKAIARLKTLDEASFTTPSVKDGVILLPLSASEDELGWGSGDIATAKETLKMVALEVKTGAVADELGKSDNALLSYVLKCNQTAPGDEEKGYDWSQPSPKNEEIETDAGTTVESAVCKFPPLTSDGETDGQYTKTGAELFRRFRDGNDKLKLNVAVVIRVKKDGKIVDMVPATCDDDDAFNRTSNCSDLQGEAIRGVSGEGTPLMRFETEAIVRWWWRESSDTKENYATVSSVSLSPKTVFIGDPRYNYAPESWFAYGAGALSEENWLNANGSAAADGDIFLQVSDQCRLQSVYELANLPRIGENGLRTVGDDFRGALARPEASSSKYMSFATDSKNALNSDFMWKTYDPFGRYASDPDADDDGFAALRLSSGLNGYRVCPYSDSTNILMAAFANTPHDWRCASVDNLEIASDQVQTFNQKYVWNGYSTGAQLKWENLMAVAGAFMEDVQACPAGNENEASWEVALRNLGWRTAADGSAGEKYLLAGLQLHSETTVYNTDKKFLYGFWHDSFSARQQLFLIFVRAEPAMMGGGQIRQTPPQLGARAVALVWRDPAATSDVTAPHRTRILFYRQFD